MEFAPPAGVTTPDRQLMEGLCGSCERTENHMSSSVFKHFDEWPGAGDQCLMPMPKFNQWQKCRLLLEIASASLYVVKGQCLAAISSKPHAL